jgi:branched-subunit amino acid aminotransferase/4-amino-4-deoxychorismate lyase
VIVYLNGAWVPREKASIPITDRGFLLSDGVFETARLHQGKYFRLPQHLERLEESARMLRLTTPPRPTLERLAHDIARQNQLSEGSLRITITRGSGGAGLKTRGADHPTVLITIAPVPEDWQEKAARGWSLITANTLRPSPEAVPAQLKALGRVYAILATLEAEDAGADDALLLTAKREIAEGPTWNFFWREGRVVRTAALAGGILEGVTRRIIIEIAKSAGYEVEEGLWPRAQLDRADEAFATMTSQGVVPIRSIDGRPLPATDCASMFQRRYWELVAAELRAS